MSSAEVLEQQRDFYTKVRLNCVTENDGMQGDAFGLELPHISPREIILFPGDSIQFAWANFEDEGGPPPASNNLFTHNTIVADHCHAKITTGKFKTSAYLIDMGSKAGTYVNHGKHGNEKDNFEKLTPREPVQVESGAQVRLGKDPMSYTYKEKQIMCVPAIWTLVIEPLDAAHD